LRASAEETASTDKVQPGLGVAESWINTVAPFVIWRSPESAWRASVPWHSPDAFPVTQGHTLIVPKRHVASLFDLPDEEQVALWKLVAQVRGKLASELQPDGFNVGVNDGPAAGQTVPHAHIHLIPRRMGDVADPRGGVRWIIPNKAAYWEGGQT
jgi:diadenosine tetraphosphate (Ap4A) HIT family hydrolase